MTLLFKPDKLDPAPLLAALGERMPDRKIRLYLDTGPTAGIEYALVYDPPRGLLATLSDLKAMFSLWAGIDHMQTGAAPPGVPVIRMVYHGMGATMTAHVVQQVLMLHNEALAYRSQQARHVWTKRQQVAPWDRRVGVLGLGALGADAARALADLGFTVAGWSRSAKAIDGIDCRHGEAGLDELIAHSDIVVCLLPLTPETENILDAALFARLPRGGHLVEDDLVAALETGHLSAAALDVTREEPPPPTAASAAWNVTARAWRTTRAVHAAGAEPV